MSITPTFHVNINGVTLPNSYQSINTFAYYDNYNTAWNLNGKITNNSIQEGHVADIPVHLCTMLILNGKFYAGIQAVTPANGGNYTINAVEMTPDHLNTLMKNLP